MPRQRRARGEGSLRKRSDGRWEGRYTAGRDESGKLLYKNVLARTQAECKAKLREAVRSAQQGSTSSTPQKPKERSTEAAQSDSIFTVGEWLRTWYDLYTKPNIRATTQEYYSNFIEHHLDWRDSFGQAHRPTAPEAIPGTSHRWKSTSEQKQPRIES